MAYQKYLQLLNEGKDIWNKYRHDEMYDVPDFNGADLSNRDLRGFNFVNTFFEGAHLMGSNFSRCYMAHSYLKGADFSSAHMIDTNLSKCELIDAKFTGVDLSHTGFSDSNLTGADFQKTRLLRTDFTRAVLKNANFTQASFVGTILSFTDMQKVIGLENCVHEGPSVIDPATLLISGSLPIRFLRGCGVPDSFVKMLSSDNVVPIKYHSCFISYSSHDSEFAQRLYDDLQEHGVLCWFAPHDMGIGARIRQTLDDQIRTTDKLLLILSESSVRSHWVEKEVETAFEEEARISGTKLLPIRLDDSVMDTDKAWASDIRRQRNIGNFSLWEEPLGYKRAFEQLLDALKMENGG